MKSRPSECSDRSSIGPQLDEYGRAFMDKTQHDEQYRGMLIGVLRDAEREALDLEAELADELRCMTDLVGDPDELAAQVAEGADVSVVPPAARLLAVQLRAKAERCRSSAGAPCLQSR